MVSASSSQAPHVMEISLISATRKAVLSGIRKMDHVMNSELDDEVPCSGSSRIRIPCNIYSAQVLFFMLYIQFNLKMLAVHI